MLTPDDLFGGSKYADSVVLGRALLDEAGALMTSDDEKVCLSNPFEIPLRALYSKKIKNLLWAGEHISASSRVSRTLSHSPVCGQMGVAAGVCAWKCIEKKRLPRTLAKAGYVDELRKTLIRSNHLVGRDLPEDEDNLSIGSSVIASSTLDKCISPESLEGIEFIRANACLLRFPFAGDRLDKVSLLASIRRLRNGSTLFSRDLQILSMSPEIVYFLLLFNSQKQMEALGQISKSIWLYHLMVGISSRFCLIKNLCYHFKQIRLLDLEYT